MAKNSVEAIGNLARTDDDQHLEAAAPVEPKSESVKRTGVVPFEQEDGRVAVSLSPGKMCASITILPGRGTGRPAPWESVEEAVADAGISKGVNEELLRKAHERASAGRPVEDLIFARGQHPHTGTVELVEILVEMASGKDVAIRKNGRADFRNQDRITIVTAGTPLARLRLPTEAVEDGWDVTGQPVRAEEHESKRVEAGENVSVRDEGDGTQLLVADVTGELLLTDNRFEVRAGHTVDGDVDLSSGNVRFPGNVLVKGSVRSGFYVFATGDIHVAEMVEAALLSADGDIVINRGVKGAGKAVLRTKKNVGLVFAEQTTILAVGDIQARNSLVHCQVKSNGVLRMTGGRTGIVGGTVRCRRGLETHNLGSGRGVKTVVCFGQDFLVADRIEREEKEIERAKEEIAQINFAMKEKERGHEKAGLDKLHSQKLALLKTVEKRALRVFTLRERFEEHHEGTITVRDTLHPGVVFESHGRRLEIGNARRNVAVFFNPESGRIEVKDRGAGDVADGQTSDQRGQPATAGSVDT